MRLLRQLGIGCVCLAVGLVGCAAPGPPAQPSSRPVVRVELLAYSGRENPQWELTSAEVDELTSRVATLSPGPAPPEPPGLGYGGFRITVSGPPAALADTIVVYHGFRLGSPGDGATRKDDRGLEQWLLSLGRARNHGDLIDALGL